MTLNIPDTFLEESGITAKDLLLELAMNRYDQEKISRAQARLLAGVDDYTLEVELEKRGLGFDYDLEDFEQDMKSLEKLKSLAK